MEIGCDSRPKEEQCAHKVNQVTKKAEASTIAECRGNDVRDSAGAVTGPKVGV